MCAGRRVKAPGLIGVAAIALTCAWAAPSLWRRVSSLVTFARSLRPRLKPCHCFSGRVGLGAQPRCDRGFSELAHAVGSSGYRHIPSGRSSPRPALRRLVGRPVPLGRPWRGGGRWTLGVLPITQVGDAARHRHQFSRRRPLWAFLQPWYLVWGIVILAAAYGPRIATGIVWLTIVASFLGPVGLNHLATELGSLGPSLELLLVAVLVASAIAPIATYPGSEEASLTTVRRHHSAARFQR